MSSQARINASRANGSKSRGPITPEGKAISSQNALRHGLMSSTILIDDELPERFEILLASLVAEHRPETASELLLVENMAVCKWRQLRVWGLENIAHSEEIRRVVADSAEIAARGPAERAYYGMRELLRNSSMMDAMSRYETRFDRQYMRSLKMLEDRRAKNSDFAERTWISQCFPAFYPRVKL